MNTPHGAEEVPTKTADVCQRMSTLERRESSSFPPAAAINCQIPGEDAMNHNCTPSKSYVVSERFTQPAKMHATNRSYPFPSPMHAVLIQYDKPIIEAGSSDQIKRNCEKQPEVDAKRHQAKSDEEAEEELSTTKFIQKLVRRSNSFKRLKELKTQKNECRKNKELKRSLDKEGFVKNKMIPVDIHLDEEVTTREKTQPLPQHDPKTNATKSDSLTPAERQGRKTQVPSRHSSSTRSKSLSRVSVTSSDADGGYFSHPNSPQSTLKSGRSNRQSYQPQTSRFSKGFSTSATEDRDNINLVEQNSKRGNVLRDTTKGQSRICQRSHSFSGGTNLPLSVYQQRPRSHSTSGPMKPYPKKKRYSFSGALPSSRREPNAKLTLSFLTVMNDVPDTFI